MNIKERFDNAIDYLYKVNDCLSAEVTKLGYPKFVKEIPTAGVSWDKERKKICFMFNEEFAKTLDDKQFAFVVSHEAMHIVNMHVFKFRDMIDDMKAKRKSEVEIDKFHQKLNIAADCIVNDSLVNLYGLDKMESLGTIPTLMGPHPVEPAHGMEKIKCHTHDMDLMSVYYLIPDDPGDDIQGHDWSSFMNPDGSMSRDFIEKIHDFIENNRQNSAMSDKQAAEIDKMLRDMKDSSDPKTRAQAGKGNKNHVRAVDGLGSNAVNWSNILFRFVETKKTVDDWNRPNRKMSSIYPDVILPSYVQQEKEEIFLAIDTSGSISDVALKLFLEVARNTPMRFKINAITFTTSCVPYDVRGKDYPVGGGGTNFGIIEEYIQNTFKNYPKAVIVLTDGAGTEVHPKHPERWMWMLYGECSTHCVGNMKWRKILEMLK
jgi:predicted metal-dependent peptidase